jgi:8-oxo-dGTP pyrophosphatase MutT (NUDIX family)
VSASGETGEVAIHRELIEELGVSFSPSREQDFSCTSEGGKRFDAFVVDHYNGTISNREPLYCGELAWFALHELPEPLTPATAQILGLLKAAP